MASISGDGQGDSIAQSIFSAIGAAGGSRSATDDYNVPMWRTRPRRRTAPMPQPGVHRVPGTREITPGPRESDYASKEGAASSWLDMSQADRDRFAMYAVRYGLIKPGEENDPSAVMNAWEFMVHQASSYNSSHPRNRWVSPWEAIHRFAGQRLAGSNGAVDLYRPQTNRSVTQRKFTREEIQPTLDEIFEREMGRTPTKRELGVYLKAIQAAYNRHPETTVQKIKPGPDGTDMTTTVSGGINVPAELMNRTRDTDESDAYQAGATYMQALEQAIRAPV